MGSTLPRCVAVGGFIPILPNQGVRVIDRGIHGVNGPDGEFGMRAYGLDGRGNRQSLTGDGVMSTYTCEAASNRLQAETGYP